MKNRTGVVLITAEGIHRIHPARARKLIRAREVSRPRGKNFRLALNCDGTTATLRERGRQSLQMERLRILFSSALVPMLRAHMQDGRWLRGMLLKALDEYAGRKWRDRASNHGGAAKPLVAFSLGRNPNVGYVTLLARDSPWAQGLMAVLTDMLSEAAQSGASWRVQRGRDHEASHGVHVLNVQHETVRPRGTYIGVVADTEAEALGMVPGALWADRMGEGGHRGRTSLWRVRSGRTRNLPPQVGACGSYGCGVLM